MTAPRPGPTVTWAARAAAALWLIAVGVVTGIEAMPVTTWAHPLATGPITADHAVVELRRSDVALIVGVEGPTGREGLEIRRRVPVAGPQPLGFAGRYRVDTAGRAPPQEVADAVLAQLTAWEAQTPRPPAFLALAGPRPSPLDRVEVALSHGAAALTVAGVLALLPELLIAVGLSPAAWGLGGLVAALGGALVVQLGAMGAWHANEHAHDRISDLTFGTPAALANLARVHGTGFYAVAGPLVGGGPDGGRPVLPTLLALSLAGLAPWLATFRLWLGDAGRALAALTALVCAAPWLRLAGSEAMYVPVLPLLGLTALATELVLATGRIRWLAFGAPALVVVAHSRADLLVLAPAAVVLRLVSGAGGGPALLLRPPVATAVVAVAAAIAPRAWALLHTERPPVTPRGAVWLDPRWLAAVGLAAVGLAAMGRDDARRSARVRAVASAVGVVVAAVSARGWWVDLKPWGADPAWQVHAGLDPRWVAPWVLAALLVGAARAVREAPTAAGFALVAVGTSSAVLLPVHDCTSTYVAVAWPTLPLLAALAALAARPGVVAALAISGVAWSASWVGTTWPKAEQDRALRALVAEVPTGTTLIALRPEDHPADPSAFHVAMVDLPRHVGDRFDVRSATAWSRGDLPAAPRVFVETLDCHRPVLSRRGPPRALTGSGEVPYALTGAPVVGPGPHYLLPDGADAPWPLCARALDEAVGVPQRARVPAGTQGSMWEEAHGEDVYVGWWPVP